MRMKRILVGVVGGALLGLTPMALATTAAQAGEAADTETRVILDKQPVKVYRYDQKVTISGAVAANCPADPTTLCRLPDTADGIVKIYRKIAGASRYKLLGQRADEGDFSLTSPSRGKATYLVKYTGGTYESYTFAPSSFDRVVKGSRNPRGKGDKRSGRLYYQGNVDPGWGGKGVVIQKKACKSCSWKGFKTVRTNRKGGYSARIYAPNSGNWYWRAKVKASKPTFVTGYGNVVRTFRIYGRTADGSTAQVR
jgi:hypothetical protein